MARSTLAHGYAGGTRIYDPTDNGQIRLLQYLLRVGANVRVEVVCSGTAFQTFPHHEIFCSDAEKLRSAPMGLRIASAKDHRESIVEARR